MKQAMSTKSLERLIQYRRILQHMADQGLVYCFSHQLAAMANNSAAQVRRDLMQLGYSGSSQKGYAIQDLLATLRDTLTTESTHNVALAGVGNLGRAILSYFSYRSSKFNVVASFDNDAAKTERVICGCRCFSMDELDQRITEMNIQIGIIAVPVDQAQVVADRMVNAGIKALLNFAPFTLRVPDDVVVETLDITLALEKIAFLYHNKFQRELNDVRE
jgi:redox-sensing transcriptional repressor